MKQLKTLLITEIEEIATSIIDEAIKDEERRLVLELFSKIR